VARKFYEVQGHAKNDQMAANVDTGSHLYGPGDRIWLDEDFAKGYIQVGILKEIDPPKRSASTDKL
jgi:hypothetical protein